MTYGILLQSDFCQQPSLTLKINRVCLLFIINVFQIDKKDVNGLVSIIFTSSNLHEQSATLNFELESFFPRVTCTKFDDDTPNSGVMDRLHGTNIHSDRTTVFLFWQHELCHRCFSNQSLDTDSVEGNPR